MAVTGCQTHLTLPLKFIFQGTVKKQTKSEVKAKLIPCHDKMFMNYGNEEVSRQSVLEITVYPQEIPGFRGNCLFWGRNKEMWPVLLHRELTPNQTVIFNLITCLQSCGWDVLPWECLSLRCLCFPGFAGSSSASTSFPPPRRKGRNTQ